MKSDGPMQINTAVMAHNLNVVVHILTVTPRSAKEKYLIVLQMVCFNRLECWATIFKCMHCLRLFYSEIHEIWEM